MKTGKTGKFENLPLGRAGKNKGTEEFRHFHGATPFLPFSAPAGLLPALREDALPIAIGVGVTVLLRWFHPNLFGG